MRGPICIGGLDRSGKTTMAAFLTSHPNIAIPPVGSNMWTYFYGRFGNLDTDGNLDRCLDAMLRYSHVRILESDPDRIRSRFAEGPPTYARLFATFLQAYAERAGKPRWGEQTGLVERYADDIFEGHPDARIVHMVRDPRDRYAASLQLWPDGRGRAGGATARWIYSTGLARRHRRRHPDGYMVVRYEDMVAQPEETLRAVCAFVGEAYCPEMLWMPSAPERRERLVSHASVPLTRSPLTPEYIGAFRGVVPQAEIAFIQLHARRLMRAYSYELDSLALAGRALMRFVAVDWPNQAARLVAWRGREALEQHLPAVAGRRPDPKALVPERSNPR